MKNSFVLGLRNHHYVLSAKKRTNPSLRDNDINVGELKEADLIFGKFDIQDDFTLINHILLLGKYYIYSPW